VHDPRNRPRFPVVRVWSYRPDVCALRQTRHRRTVVVANDRRRRSQCRNRNTRDVLATSAIPIDAGGTGDPLATVKPPAVNTQPCFATAGLTDHDQPRQQPGDRAGQAGVASQPVAVAVGGHLVRRGPARKVAHASGSTDARRPKEHTYPRHDPRSDRVVMARPPGMPTEDASPPLTPRRALVPHRVMVVDAPRRARTVAKIAGLVAITALSVPLCAAIVVGGTVLAIMTLR